MAASSAGEKISACTRNLGGSISRNAAAHATGPSGCGARCGRCGRCVESVLHVSPRRPQAREGRRDFGNPPEARNQEPETRTRGRVTQFAPFRFGIPACTRNLGGSTPRGGRSARNGAFRVRSPRRSLRTLRGVASARLLEMAVSSAGKKSSATRQEPGTRNPKPEPEGVPKSPPGLGFRPACETSAVRPHAADAAHAAGPFGFAARGGRCGRCVGSVLHVPPRWPKARGAKRFRQHVPETRDDRYGTASSKGQFFVR